ncbi:MAG: hypothetical protein GQ477_04400 [Nanohaloarchaea archaeon]|nr:hypothetical protein [Candidatus Nanohaloarchaea archaeon]
MAGMEILIGNMNTMGFYDFFLPFILFVAIVFGLLQKNKVFGDKETKSIDSVVSMSVSFFIINYTAIGLYFTTLFAIGATIIGALLVGVIILGMVGIDLGGLLGENENKKMRIPIVAGAGVVVIILFLYASGLYEKISDYIPSIGEDTIVTIVGILFFIAVFVMITGTGKKKK